MSIHSQIRSALLALPAVAAIVVDRVRADAFWKGDGEGAQDAILVEIDAQDRENDLDGHGGLVVTEFTLTCRSSTLARSEALAEAVRTNGTNPGTGLAGATIDGVDYLLDAETDAWTPKGDGSEVGWFDMVLSFTAIYTETT